MLFDDVGSKGCRKAPPPVEAAPPAYQRMLLMLPLLPVTFTSTFLNTK
jgi:hypothetical protein